MNCIHQLPAGGALIGASRGGWFVAYEAAGKVTLTPAGNTDTGRVMLMHDVAGLVSIGDLVKYRLAEMEREREAMKEYIATA